MVTCLVQLYGSVYGLQKGFFVNTSKDEAGLVERLGALGAGADADGREGMADACEET